MDTISRAWTAPCWSPESGGGVEDPRVVRVDGMFYMTYTAWDLKKPRQCLATSTDLVHWEKKGGPLFPDFFDVEYPLEGRMQIREGFSKSGAIFPERNAEGRYIMIFGEAFLCVTESEHLIHWRARPFNKHFATGIHLWESRLLKPGPTIKTRDGKWILVYNVATMGAPGYRNNQYSVSQMLIDLDCLRGGPLARLDKPSLVVSALNEQTGQVNKVVFCEGMVQFRGRWFMYYGQGDSELGVATADAR
jgi:predicted GH43/DUF377 family glycosyl hydrolase